MGYRRKDQRDIKKVERSTCNGEWKKDSAVVEENWGSTCKLEWGL